MKQLTILFMVILLPTLSSASSRKLKLKRGIVSSVVQRQWGKSSETLVEKVFKAPYRAVVRPVYHLATGKTVKRMWNVIDGTQNAVVSGVQMSKGQQWDAQERLERAGYKFSDSVLNPLSAAMDVASDAVMTMKQPFYLFSKSSSRIKLCTSNLWSGIFRGWTFLHQVAPAEHVALWIDDGRYETQDAYATRDLHMSYEKGGIMCTQVPLLKNESESMAIERVTCVDRNYHAPYDFVLYNCGGYTKDVLYLSGLGYPGMPNLGVGNHIGTTLIHRAKGKSAKASCTNHVDQIRDIIFDLEEGKDTRVVSAYAPDTTLQMFISAARGGNSYNRSQVDRLSVDTSFYFNKKGKVKLKYRRLLRKMFMAINQEGYEWLKSANSSVSRLYEAVCDLYKVDPNTESIHIDIANLTAWGGKQTER